MSLIDRLQETRETTCARNRYDLYYGSRYKLGSRWISIIFIIIWGEVNQFVFLKVLAIEFFRL